MKTNELLQVEGWKNISSYVNLSERHLRRLVHDGTFPIHRKGKGTRAPIFALGKDLDAFNTTYWEKEIVQKHSPYRMYLIPFILLFLWVGLLIIPRYEEAPYYGHYEIKPNNNMVPDLLLFDQYGNRTTTLKVSRPRLQDHRTDLIWCPNLEETPVILEILTNTNPDEIMIHRLGVSPQVWNPPRPWITEGSSAITQLYRMKTHAFDGVLLVRKASWGPGVILQLFNRRKELIAELFSESDIHTLKWDRRFLTLCREDGSEQKVNLWQWVSQQGIVLREPGRPSAETENE